MNCRQCGRGDIPASSDFCPQCLSDFPVLSDESVPVLDPEEQARLDAAVEAMGLAKTGIELVLSREG